MNIVKKIWNGKNIIIFALINIPIWIITHYLSYVTDPTCFSKMDEVYAENYIHFTECSIMSVIAIFAILILFGSIISALIGLWCKRKEYIKIHYLFLTASICAVSYCLVWLGFNTLIIMNTIL